MLPNKPVSLFPFTFIVFIGMMPGSSVLAKAESSSSTNQKGVVFIVGGVGGFDILGTASQWELPRAGVHHEVRDFTWTHGWGQVFKDLQDRPHLLQKAEMLAAEIQKIKKNDPDRPVYLVGKSGGAGLVLAAAERLPPDSVERIILLSAAVSPNYDLRPAFRATRREIVSFHSPYDQFILGWGTSYFGTTDRVYGPSAGLHGFNVPGYFPQEDQALYQRLVQIPWNSTMILEGHWGNHVGTSLPAFVGQEVAPWLKENPKSGLGTSK
jgi:pimeloyl-ACP methyl ester carboxylesterase